MDREPLIIDWKDLTTPAVEARLQRLSAVKATLNHYETSQNVVSAGPQQEKVWYNAAVFLGFFGLLGGVLGWAFGEILHFRPDLRTEARQVIADYESVKAELGAGDVRADVARDTLRAIASDFKANPYFALYIDPALSQDERDRRMQDLDARDNWNNFIANLLFFGFSGLMIAVCLGMAEPLVERNFNRAAVNGIVGALLGLTGGVAVALVIPKLHAMVLGDVSELPSRTQLILAKVVEWGVLGLFLAAAPGVLLGSIKRLGIGLGGGLIGGIVGGILFVPLAESFNEHLSRFVGIVTIGLIAGVASGLIEGALKTGWLKVTAGLIAGKQFVVYRNPTYIGAHPSCHIFLWKDPKVGKRHAAVHVVQGGIEIENLPLGGATLVNGQAVQRMRLRAGDRIQIGKTSFEFHERKKAA